MFMRGMNQPRTQAASVGAIRRWKDGRNMPDVHVVIYYYGDLPVTMRLNLGTEAPESYRFHGSKGLMEVTGSGIHFSPQTGEDNWPSYYTRSYPRGPRGGDQKQGEKEDDPKPGEEGKGGNNSNRGPPLHEKAPP